MKKSETQRRFKFEKQQFKEKNDTKQKKVRLQRTNAK